MRRRQRFLFKLGLIGTIAIFLFLLFNNALSPKTSVDNIQAEARVQSRSKSNNIFEADNELEKAQENQIANVESRGEKIDWHDYDAITRDLHREGLGEHGKKAYLENHDRDREKLMYRQNGFNAMLSDEISVNRSIPDIRYSG